MRRIVVTSFIVFSALTLSWIGGASGQRVREAAAATTRPPTPVEVTNFPAAAPVTVNVITPTIHFAGFSRFPLGTIGGLPNVLDLNRVCNADLPGTRTCTKDEIALSIPPPPSSPDRAWTLESATGTSNQFSLQAGCTSEFDTDITPCGQGPYLIACCGF